MAYAPPKECVRGLCPRGSVFTRGPMERGDSAAQVDRVGCATAAREGRCGRRTDGSRFCSASSSTTGRVVSPLMPLTTPGTQHHSTPSSLRTISRKNPARAGAPPRARGARKPDPWARAHCAGKFYVTYGCGGAVGRVSHGIGHLRCGDRSADVRPRLGWWCGGSGGPGGAGVVVRAVVLRSKTVTHSTLSRRRCCPHGSSGARDRFSSDPRVSNRSTSPRARRLSTRISRRSSQRNHRLAMNVPVGSEWSR